MINFIWLCNEKVTFVWCVHPFMIWSCPQYPHLFCVTIGIFLNLEHIPFSLSLDVQFSPFPEVLSLSLTPLSPFLKELSLSKCSLGKFLSSFTPVLKRLSSWIPSLPLQAEWSPVFCSLSAFLHLCSSSLYHDQEHHEVEILVDSTLCSLCLTLCVAWVSHSINV